MYSYREDPLYNDRYQFDKGWVRILPIPGRPLQAAELNEMQSIWMGHLKETVGSLYKNGSPLIGLRITDTYTVTPGVIVVDGVGLPVEGKELLGITAQGEYRVEVVVKEQVITETDDPDLRDPSTGGASYGVEGAHRLIWTTSIEVNPSISGYRIGSIINGKVYQAPLATTFPGLDELLAIQTYERAGNFLVNGFSVTHSHTVPGDPLREPTTKELEMREQLILLEGAIGNQRTIVSQSSSPRDEDLSRLTQLQQEYDSIKRQLELAEDRRATSEVFTVSPGVAYVLGYRVSKQIPETLSIPRRDYTRAAISARYTYIADTQINTRTLTSSGPVDYLEVTFTGIQEWVRVKCQLAEARPIEELIDVFILGLRSDIPEVVFTSPQVLSGAALRAVVGQYLSVEREGQNSIQFRLIQPIDIGIRVVGPPTISIVPSEDYITYAVSLKRYELAMKPVARILRVVADLEANLVPITRGKSDDPLPDDTVLDVQRIEQGQVVYIKGVDYQLSGNSIKWLSVGPSEGSTYYVTYRYTEPLGVDEYQLVNNMVEFTGRRPHHGGLFTVDYEYYLKQGGLVYVTREGEVAYTLTPPGPEPVYPTPNPEVLPLARFILTGAGPLIEEFTYPRMNAQTLNEMLRLCQETARRIEGPQRRSALSDIDSTQSQVTYIGEDTFTVVTTMKTVPLRYLGGGSLHTKYPIGRGVVSLDKGGSIDSPALIPDGADQPRVTNHKRLTPTKEGRLYLYPRHIFLGANGRVTQRPTGTTPFNSRTESNYQAFESGHPIPLGIDSSNRELQLRVWGQELDDSVSYQLWLNGIEQVVDIVVGRVTAIGARPLKGLIELVTNLQVQPGTHLIELRPTTPTAKVVKGVLSIYSPLEGSIFGSPTHTKETLSRRHWTPKNLYQTFILRGAKQVTGVSLRLRRGNGEVRVSIVDVESSIVLGVAQADSYYYTWDGSQATDFQFNEPITLLPDRVYAIDIEPDGGDIELFYAILGEPDLITGRRDYIGAQVYNGGHLYLPGGLESYNEDLTYNLQLAYYVNESVVVDLGEYGAPDLFPSICAFSINTRDIVPSGTQVRYEYEAGGIWKMVVANKYTELSELSERVRIRAILFTTAKELSPLINLEGATVSLYSYQEYGVYRSMPLEKGGELEVSIEWEGQGKLVVSTPFGVMTPIGDSAIGTSIRQKYKGMVGEGQRIQVELLSGISRVSPPVVRSLTYHVR